MRSAMVVDPVLRSSSGASVASAMKRAPPRSRKRPADSKRPDCGGGPRGGQGVGRSRFGGAGGGRGGPQHGPGRGAFVRPPEKRAPPPPPPPPYPHPLLSHRG